MNWSYRGSWLETTPPHATRVRSRAWPRDTTLLHIVAAVPGPPPHHGFSTKTACDQASTPGSGLGLNAGSGDNRRPLSSVRGPRALRAAPGGGVQAAGLCKCLFSLVFVFFFFCHFTFFLIPPRGESRGTGAGSRGGVGEGMMDGSGSRPPAPRSGVSTRAPGPSGTGSGASAGGPRHRPHRRPHPHPHLPRTTSCPV